MKKFLIHTALFVIVICGLCYFFNSIFTVYGDDRYEYRYKYLEKDLTNYNTLFFGSSRTLRHCIPTLFDSLNLIRGVKTRSFNLGAPANRSFETYEQYSKFLEKYKSDKKNTIKNVFIEIHPLDGIADKNLTSKRSYYWVNSANLDLVCRYFATSKIAYGYKYVLIKNYVLAYLLNNFGFKFSPNLKKPVDAFLIGRKQDGYISLVDEIQQTKDAPRRSVLVEFREAYLRDTNALNKRMIKVRTDFANVDKRNANEVHYKRLQALLKQSKALNINLYFIIQPRLSSYKDVLAIKALLPKNVIEIADPMKYPQLWHYPNSFDIGHMNEKGGKFYTEMLSAKFIEATLK